MLIAYRFVLLFFITCATSLWANQPSSPWYTIDSHKKVDLNIELFISSTCPYCQHADAFFKKIELSNPWLHVHRLIIDKDEKALLRFNKILSTFNEFDFSVPAIFLCDSHWIGFSSEETSGKDLLRALNFCKNQIEKNGELTPATVNVLKRWANANFLETGFTENTSNLSYITFVALMDAYNPCALFSIAGFFAFLFLQENRKKQLITGLLFALVVIGTHFVQQVYTNSFFELLPWLRLPAVFVGVFVLYFIRTYYQNRVNTRLFFLSVFLVALMVQIYQQSCVMNWSYIFQQWLNNQSVTPSQALLIQFYYQFIYVLQLIILLILYTIMSRLTFFRQRKHQFQTVGLSLLAGLAVILIVYPYLLSNIIWSVLVGALLFIGGWFLSRYIKEQ